MRTNIETGIDENEGHVAAAVPAPPAGVDKRRSGKPMSVRAASRPRHPLIGQLASFGAIGGLAFVVDIGAYNVLRASVLDQSPIWAKVVSVAIATLVAWLGNRYVTFRRERSDRAVREGLLFALVNIGGLLIAAACLFVSHYLFGFTSQLADNIAGNGVGLVLGTAFRFATYRWLVFSPRLPSLAVPLPAPRTVRLDAGGLP